MTLETVKKVRAELHHLVAADRDVTNEDGSIGINIPLKILFNFGNGELDEAAENVFWDDANESVYTLGHNSEPSSQLTTICDWQVRVVPYSEIIAICARLDNNTTMTFLGKMKERGLTSQVTIDRIREQAAQADDPRSYTMGQPSKSTTKGPMNPSDEIIPQNFFKTL